RLAPGRGNLADGAVRIAGRGLQHGQDPRLGGRHDRQPVGPASPVVEGVDGLQAVLHLDPTRAEDHPPASPGRPTTRRNPAAASRTRPATSSGESPPSGCWTTRSGTVAIPRAWAARSAMPVKVVVQITAAGVPSRWRATASWTLHDVHDPQSPDPAKTRSHSLASSARSSGPAGLEAFRLRRIL